MFVSERTMASAWLTSTAAVGSCNADLLHQVIQTRKSFQWISISQQSDGLISTSPSVTTTSTGTSLI